MLVYLRRRPIQQQEVPIETVMLVCHQITKLAFNGFIFATIIQK